MEIKITIEGLDQLTESLALIASALAFQRDMGATVKAAADVVEKISAPPVVEVPTIEEQKEVVEETIDELVAEEEETITIEEVRAAFMAKNSKGNTPRLKEILKKFKVAKVTDLDEKDFAEVLSELEAI